MIGSFLTRGLLYVIIPKNLNIFFLCFYKLLMTVLMVDRMVFGYAYPAYECFKTVEQNKPEILQLQFWCQYWYIDRIIIVYFFFFYPSTLRFTLLLYLAGFL